MIACFKASLAALAAVAVACAAPSAQAAPPFKHIVIVIQENRTPDNLFGANPTFEPGVDLATSGLTSKGTTVALRAEPLDDCYDIAHSHASFEDALQKGFDTEPLQQSHCKDVLPPNPQYKYVDDSTGTVDPYFAIARNNGFANRMFQTNQGPSFPAHQFLFGGTSAPSEGSQLFVAENAQPGNAGCLSKPSRKVTTIDFNGNEHADAPVYPCFERKTLGDLLDSAKLSWRYYAPNATSIWTAPDAISHICQAAKVNGVDTCTGDMWKKHVVADDPAQVLRDTQACKLAAVSWVIPTAAESDHAASNKGLGPQWVASIVNTIGQQSCGAESYWNDTAILILWDDWGGWYDHVPPVEINIGHPGWGAGYTYGFRVPLMVVSAYTPTGYVDNANHDFGSVLRYTESNFGLGFIQPDIGTYGRYADYYATKSPFTSLDAFFTLPAPKPFVAIPTTVTTDDFLRMPKSDEPPDTD